MKLVDLWSFEPDEIGVATYSPAAPPAFTASLLNSEAQAYRGSHSLQVNLPASGLAQDPAYLTRTVAVGFGDLSSYDGVAIRLFPTSEPAAERIAVLPPLAPAITTPASIGGNVLLALTLIGELPSQQIAYYGGSMCSLRANAWNVVYIPFTVWSDITSSVVGNPTLSWLTTTTKVGVISFNGSSGPALTYYVDLMQAVKFDAAQTE